MATTSPPNSPPASPPPSQPSFYISPHSPTPLRFPPSATYAEWRGRCFRCCRTGHTFASCCNPMKCGKCWSDGHVGNRCKSKALNPTALPFWSDKIKQQQSRAEQPPACRFDDLLKKPCPLAGLTMPANRPKCLFYFAEKDKAMTDELARLARGVVFDTHGIELGFSLQDVLEFVSRTGGVDKTEVSIAILSKSRFLIILPQGLAPETFIQATGPELWEAGFSFQPWSPLDHDRLALPEYKVLIRLLGVTPHFFSEHHISKAVSIFGTYLGSVPGNDLADISSWTVAVVVDRLERVSEEVYLNAGAIESVAQLHICNWIRSPLYKAAELPKLPPKFSKPIRQPGANSVEQQEPFCVSRKVLLEICKGKEFATLPEEVRMFLASIPRAAEFVRDGSREGDAAMVEDLVTPTPPILEVPACNTHEAGQNPNHTLNHSDTYTNTRPQQILKDAIASMEKATQSINLKEPGHKTLNDDPILNPRPQLIDTGIQILKRCPAKQISRVPALIPMPGKKTREASNRGNGDTCTTGQRMNRAGWEKGKKSKKQLEKVVAKSNKGVMGREKQRPAKPKDVALGPCCAPLTFKRSQNSTQRSTQQQKEQARKAKVTRNKDGLTEVNVEFAHISALGLAIGLPTTEVAQALEEDNLHRAILEAPQFERLLGSDMDLDQEGPDISFDPDRDVDPDSDEGAGL